MHANGGPVYGPFKVDIKVTSKEAYLANANWVYQRAVDTGIISGDNVGKATQFHLQGTADVLSALGWNAGKRVPTGSRDSRAWWSVRRPEEAIQRERMGEVVGSRR